MTSLDWRHHPVGDRKPCRLCGKPAMMRDATGTACHKVCAEQEQNARQQIGGFDFRLGR